MRKFLYWFPGKNVVTQKDFEEVGLDRIFTPTTTTSGGSHAADNPTHSSTGCLLCVGNADGVGYLPEKQTWMECADGKFWLGYETGDPPRPEDLEGSMRPGYSIELGDGRLWRIPIATSNTDEDVQECFLPQTITLDKSGQRIKAVAPKYHTLMQYASTMFDVMANTAKKDADLIEVDEDFRWNACVEALSTNYLVTQWEVAALGLIDTSNEILILTCICDWYSYLNVLEDRAKAAKKNDALSIDAT